MFSTTNVAEKWNMQGFERMKRDLASGCHLLTKTDQRWRTTRGNYKNIPQIVCISFRFRVLHLLSCNFERSEVLWRYTVIIVLDTLLYLYLYKLFLWQMTGVRIVSCRSADFNMFQITSYKYNSVSSEDFGLLKFPWKKVQHSESGWFEVYVCSYVELLSMKVDRLFLKDDNQRRDFTSDIAHKITFSQSFVRSNFLKRLLLRTLDVNIVKLCNI